MERDEKCNLIHMPTTLSNNRPAKTEGRFMKKMTALELMLCVKNERIQIYYHRDTKVFDLMPVSQFELEHIDWDIAGIRTI